MIARADHTSVMAVDPLEQYIADRRSLLAAYHAISADVRRHLSPAVEMRWRAGSLALYQANAGSALLEALWQLQRRALVAGDGDIILAYGDAVHGLCLHSGARDTAHLVRAIMVHFPHGGDATKLAQLLDGIAALSARAPEAAGAVTANLGILLARLVPNKIPVWAADGLKLYPSDRRKRLAYFRLDDPLARQRLTVHEGAVHFETHKERLVYLARALFGVELETQVVNEDGRSGDLCRPRLAGNIILMPALAPKMPPERIPDFFEAAVLHALAHRRFTCERFPVGRMKPMQIALTSLLEDARVERLAARVFPGLGRLWRSFHDVPASRGRSCASLFARLARGLADPDFQDADGWVQKGRSLFEAAFSQRPDDQAISQEIARILGHDLGQMRIPFDAKSYFVEPNYRDDGLGLFDLGDSAEADDETLEILLDAARMQPSDDNGSDKQDPPGSDVQSARSRPAKPDDGRGTLLGQYPEWNYRLHTDQHSAASVFAHPPTPLPTPNWLNERLENHGKEAGRIGGLVSRARMGRAVRLKRRLEGDDLDLEALTDTVIARKAGQTPDPRIYMVKRRLERDVCMALLIDTSQSTAARLAQSEASVLETSALSAALLGEALAGLGDPFAVFAFSSDGRDNVQLTTVKDFAESSRDMTGRLAGLKPAFSTRLGAALRHVGTRLSQQSSLRKVLIVITDGEPADCDTDDPDYLVEDARQAVNRARDAGLDLFCVALGENADRAAAAVFGRRHTLALERISDLPSRLAGLYFRLTVN